MQLTVGFRLNIMDLMQGKRRMIDEVSVLWK